jgi:hypothetical protein
VTLFDSIARQAGRVAGDVQVSIKRARLEGERRLLQRAHRTALESLGERALELIRQERLEEGLLAPQVAEVESALMEIDAKAAEIDALRSVDAATDEASDEHRQGPLEIGAGSPGPERTTGWEAAERYFPKS